MKASADDLLKRLSGSPDARRFVEALSHGTMSVEFYAPVGADNQQPHQQDELYIVHSGSGVLSIEGTPHVFSPGMCFFVRAGAVHRFEQFTPDFSTWVIFWGPPGGEGY